MEASTFERKYVVNVSAMEGVFGRGYKGPGHPHTNMAKAALNMLTRTSSSEMKEHGILMTAVDTGWITDERPHVTKERLAKEGFHAPLDLIDGAARVYHPTSARPAARSTRGSSSRTTSRPAGSRRLVPRLTRHRRGDVASPRRGAPNRRRRGSSWPHVRIFPRSVRHTVYPGAAARVRGPRAPGRAIGRGRDAKDRAPPGTPSSPWPLEPHRNSVPSTRTAPGVVPAKAAQRRRRQRDAARARARRRSVEAQLAAIIAAPRPHGAVAVERQGEVLAGDDPREGHGRGAGASGNGDPLRRAAELAAVIAPPAPEPAVVGERQRMIVTGGDGDDVPDVVRHGHRRLRRDVQERRRPAGRPWTNPR